MGTRERVVRMARPMLAYSSPNRSNAILGKEGDPPGGGGGYMERKTLM